MEKCSVKKNVPKTFPIFTEKHLCWSLVSIKLQTVRPLPFALPEFPTQVLSCEYWDVFKNICERLPFLSLELFCKDFVDISYENASFGILQYSSAWLQVIYFWFSTALSLKSAIMENSRHCVNNFRLFYNWPIKSSKYFSRNHVVPGLFFKNCSADKVDCNSFIS